LTLDYKALLHGIQKWLEQTTTSPSGHHLGIYKTLGKHVIKKKQQQPVSQPMGNLKQGQDVLYLIFDIMSLAI